MPEGSSKYQKDIEDWDDKPHLHRREFFFVINPESPGKRVPDPVIAKTETLLETHGALAAKENQLSSWRDKPKVSSPKKGKIDGDEKIVELENKYEMSTKEFREKYLENPTALERKIDSEDFHTWILLSEPT